MKKRKIKILFTSLIASMFLTVSSCGGDTPSGHTHSWSASWSSDETYHWHKCTGCEAINDKAEHTFVTTVIEPDYEHQGYTHHECFICEYSYNDNYVDPLEHHYSSAWSKDESAHWHACIDEGYESLSKDYALHDFGEWIIDEPATKEHDGTRHHVCNTCSYLDSETYKYKESVPAERVYLPNPATSLFKGYTYSLSPIVIPNDADKNVKYEIADSSILSIENNYVLGKNTGSSLIYAYNDNDDDGTRDNDEPFAVMSFTIKEPEEGKSVTVQDNVTIKVGESKKLTYSQTGIDSFGMEYGFYSEDESICTIASGVVKGHKAGTTRVSVSLKGYRAYCVVTVINNEDEHGLRASEIKSVDNLVLNKGDSQTLAYEILPLGSVDKLSSITSNNERVIKVNEDKSITAINGGSAVVTLTTENNKFTRVFVTVKDNANLESSYYNNYYGNLTWENGEDLKTKLHAIISKDVKPLKYNTPNWETNQVADQDLYDYSFVNAIYNDSTISKIATDSGWQREHAFAASLMTGFSTGTAVKALGRATDFHNLFAASAGANGSRGNKNLGYVNPESAEYSTKENCVFTRNAFEPNDIDKGRLARSIFYMSVMYNAPELVDIAETWTYRGDDVDAHSGKTKSLHINSNQQALQVVDGYVGYNRISINEFMYPEDEVNVPYVNYYRDVIRAENPSLETDDYDLFRELAYERYLSTAMPYTIGYFSDLLRWNSHAVDLQEVQHNESVYFYNCTAGGGRQNNRNPFVDYPQLVDYIFGELKDVGGSINELTPSYLALNMDKDEIHHYAVDSDTIPAFKSGSKPTIDDFNIKAIKNDLSEGILDKSKISVEDYTFTDEDVATGKVITISTDKNTLLVPCKVVSESVVTFDTCKFSYKPTSGNKSDYSGSETNWVATFAGVKFDVTLGAWSTSSQYFVNDNTTGMSGVKIGSGTNKLGTLVIESQQSYTNVNALFFYAAGTTNASNISYSVYVNNELKFSGSISGSTVNVIGQTFDKTSGKVKVEFSNIAGIKFCGLAFNY